MSQLAAGARVVLAAQSLPLLVSRSNWARWSPLRATVRWTVFGPELVIVEVCAEVGPAFTSWLPKLSVAWSGSSVVCCASPATAIWSGDPGASEATLTTAFLVTGLVVVGLNATRTLQVSFGISTVADEQS